MWKNRYAAVDGAFSLDAVMDLDISGTYWAQWWREGEATTGRAGISVGVPQRDERNAADGPFSAAC